MNTDHHKTVAGSLINTGDSHLPQQLLTSSIHAT